MFQQRRDGGGVRKIGSSRYMSDPHQLRRRRMRNLSRHLREVALVAKGAASTSHPIMAHIIPIRRCNLSCAYCNEYDKVSSPVSLAEIQRRIDLLAALGTAIITFSGGEPLLHPELDEMIRSIRAHGMIA